MDIGSQQTISPAAYTSIKDWCTLSGMRRTGVNQALARGDLVGIKLGVRVLIDVPHGLAWMRSLPPARPAPPGK